MQDYNYYANYFHVLTQIIMHYNSNYTIFVSLNDYRYYYYYYYYSLIEVEPIKSIDIASQLSGNKLILVSFWPTVYTVTNNNYYCILLLFIKIIVIIIIDMKAPTRHGLLPSPKTIHKCMLVLLLCAVVIILLVLLYFNFSTVFPLFICFIILVSYYMYYTIHYNS